LTAGGIGLRGSGRISTFEYSLRLRPGFSIDQAILQIASGAPHFLSRFTHGGICHFVALMRQKRGPCRARASLFRRESVSNRRHSIPSAATFRRSQKPGHVSGDAGAETISSGSRIIVASRVDLVFAR
jgi:hypothetical protein